MPEAQQLDLLEQDIAQRFAVWKGTPGGRQILRFADQETLPFGSRYISTGQRVSADYIMHRLRDRIARIQIWLGKRNISLPREGGYRINDHFTAHIARHIMAHRPEFDGMFEIRRLGAKRMVARRKIEVTEYAVVPA